MKSLLLSVSLFIVLTAQSQRETFVRIIDDHGKTIHKGFLIKTSDSSLTLSLSKNETTFEIPVSKINTIKLRRSFGHTLLLSTLIVTVPFAIIAATDNNSESSTTSLATGAYFTGVDYSSSTAGILAIGAGLGAAAGGIIGGTRSRPSYKVNMNLKQWMKVKPLLNNYLPVAKN
jgi:hypothetical protein